MKQLKRIFIGAVVLACALVAYVFIQARSLSVEKVTDDVYVLYGLGGNVGVLKTDVGTIVVDTMTLELQGAQIKKKAEALTGQAVVMLINTHYHTDHTHGNPAFAADTRVIATDRTLHHMLATDSDYFSGESKSLLPKETFSEFEEIKLGNKTLQLYQTGRGHTDGDLVVLFVEDRVIHTGDLFFNRHYPNIDLEGGGSVQEWPTTLEPILNLPFDKVIAGHGPLSDRAGLVQFQGFMQQLGEIGQKAAQEGWTKDQTQATDLFTEDKGYTEIALIVPIGLTRDFVLGRAWEEATGHYQRRD